MDPYYKIIIVVIVLTVIMTGIYIYLFSIDRKIRKLEKKIKDKINKE
ncbi:MAG: CcmD family protein [Bacteroidetes bacterium]|nr:CcmD family protein [Bacteroidota bacterium]